MDVVNNFYKIFINEDIRNLINEYDSFRLKAILDKKMYEELLHQLERVNGRIMEGWKVEVYKKFSELLRICRNYAKIGIEKSPELNQIINRFIVEPVHTISNELEWVCDIKIKYAMLHLMLDVIFAYTDSTRQIHFSAVVYDKVHEMGKMDDKIKRFYGKEAQEEVIGYTLKTIIYICEVDGKNPKKYIQKAAKDLSNSFSIKFYEKLIEKLEEDLKKNSKKKNDGNLERDDGRKLSQVNRRRFYIIITLLIILFIGVWLSRRNNYENNQIERWKEIEHQFEESLEKQSEMEDQIKGLERQIKGLERQIKVLAAGTIRDNNQTESIKSEEIEAEDVENENEETEGIKSVETETEGVETMETETEGVETVETETEGIKTEDEETEGIKTEDEETEGIKTEDEETGGIKTKEAEIEGIKSKEAEPQGTRAGNAERENN